MERKQPLVTDIFHGTDNHLVYKTFHLTQEHEYGFGVIERLCIIAGRLPEALKESLEENG